MRATPLLFKLLAALAKIFPGLLPLLGRHLLPFLFVLFQLLTLRGLHVQETFDSVVNKSAFLGRHLGKRSMQVH